MYNWVQMVGPNSCRDPLHERMTSDSVIASQLECVWCLCVGGGALACSVYSVFL